jgi:NitT/TauT family transport system substrate-binding protein
MRLTLLGWIAVGTVVAVVGGGTLYLRGTRVPHNGPVPTSQPQQPGQQLCQGLLGRPLRVGVVTWPGYAGGIAANNGFRPNKDSIYYNRHNLCVEFLLMEDTDVRQKAFARGGANGVDIVWSTVDYWANELPGFRNAGLKARAVMQVDWSRGGDAIVVDDSIKQIENLYNKRTSLAQFTPSHWLLEYSLQNSRLNERQQRETVQALVFKQASPDARADFVARRVDAAVVWEPDVAAALKQRKGSHVLVSSEQARKLIADVMVVKEDFIRDHRDVVQAFVEGWIVQGTELAHREPETVVKLLMANEPVYRDIGADVTRKNLATVKWADLADNTEMFNLDGKDREPLFDSLFNQAATSWVRRGYIAAQVTPAVAKDDSFVRSLYQKRGPVARVPDEFAPPPASVAAETPIFNGELTVNFATGKADLNAAARQSIDKVALLPKAFSGTYFKVEGNTDNVGNAQRNRELSQRRAQAVVDYLVTTYHLDRNQFLVQGNGPDKPVASNADAAGRARNRRTDLLPVKR